jgi:hypothetical protein
MSPGGHFAAANSTYASNSSGVAINVVRGWIVTGWGSVLTLIEYLLYLTSHSIRSNSSDIVDANNGTLFDLD